MGVKDSPDISQSTHHIYSSQSMYTYSQAGSLSQLLKEIWNVEILVILFVLFLGGGGWGGGGSQWGIIKCAISWKQLVVKLGLSANYLVHILTVKCSRSVRHYIVYTRYIWELSIKCYSEIFRHISKYWQPLILKTAGHRVKRTEIWDSAPLVTHLWNTFDPVVFKVILGSFGVLVSGWPATQKGYTQSEEDRNLGTDPRLRLGSLLSWPILSCDSLLSLVCK